MISPRHPQPEVLNDEEGEVFYTTNPSRGIEVEESPMKEMVQCPYMLMPKG